MLINAQSKSHSNGVHKKQNSHCADTPKKYELNAVEHTHTYKYM